MPMLFYRTECFKKLQNEKMTEGQFKKSIAGGLTVGTIDDIINTVVITAIQAQGL